MHEFQDRQRVGSLQRRHSPDRLVARYGMVISDLPDSYRPEEYVNVLWDDGEHDLVDCRLLRPMSRMKENPENLPMVSFDDELREMRLGGVVKPQLQQRRSIFSLLLPF